MQTDRWGDTTQLKVLHRLSVRHRKVQVPCGRELPSFSLTGHSKWNPNISWFWHQLGSHMLLAFWEEWKITPRKKKRMNFKVWWRVLGRKNMYFFMKVFRTYASWHSCLGWWSFSAGLEKWWWTNLFSLGILLQKDPYLKSYITTAWFWIFANNTSKWSHHN